MSGWGKVLEDRVHLFLLDEKAISKTAHDLPKVTQPVRVKTLVSDPPSSTLSISSFEMIGEGTKQEDTWLTRAGRFGGTERKRRECFLSDEGGAGEISTGAEKLEAKEPVENYCRRFAWSEGSELILSTFKG